MKRRMYSIVLCLALLISIAGCGQNDSSLLPESEPAGTNQTFGASTLETPPVEEAQTTALPAEGNLEPQTMPDSALPESDPEEPTLPVQDNTEAAVTAVIIAHAIDHLDFSPTDDQFLWRAVGYLAGQLGTGSDLVSSDGDFGALTPDHAAILAYAVNGSFSGELPAVTEEDPLISKTEEGSYLVNMLSQGSLELQMTENRYTSSEDTVTEEAELIQDGVSLGTYNVTLQKYSGDEAGNAFFAYSIVGLSSTENQ